MLSLQAIESVGRLRSEIGSPRWGYYPDECDLIDLDLTDELLFEPGGPFADFYHGAIGPVARFVWDVMRYRGKEQSRHALLWVSYLICRRILPAWQYSCASHEPERALGLVRQWLAGEQSISVLSELRYRFSVPIKADFSIRDDPDEFAYRGALWFSETVAELARLVSGGDTQHSASVIGLATVTGKEIGIYTWPPEVHELHKIELWFTDHLAPLAFTLMPGAVPSGLSKAP